MFNKSTVKTGLFGLIGFRDTDDPDYKSLATALTASSSGMYYSDYHPLVNYENMYSIAPNYDGYNYSDYSATATYATGDFAKSLNLSYEAVTTVPTGQLPGDTLGTYWKLPVNDWLTQKVEASINKVVNNVFVNKKLNETTKTFIDNVQIFEGAGRMQDVITPNSRFVGLRIRPKRINNIAVFLNYIGFQFTEIQTGLNIYLFHSGKYAPVSTTAFTTAAAYSFDWKASTIELNYVDYDNDIDSGGDYFLGYFEDDISGNAIKKRHQFADPPCGGCGGGDLSLYNLWSKYVEIQPFEVASGDLNGTNIWDLSKTGYPLSTNFGLNLSLSVKFDITDIIVSNKSLFTDALGYQFAYDMLQEFVYNPQSRLNKHGDNAQKQSILYDLNGEDSIRTKLEKQLEAVGFDLSRISQALPNDVKRRIHVGAK